MCEGMNFYTRRRQKICQIKSMIYELHFLCLFNPSETFWIWIFFFFLESFHYEAILSSCKWRHLPQSHFVILIISLHYKNIEQPGLRSILYIYTITASTEKNSVELFLGLFITRIWLITSLPIFPSPPVTRMLDFVIRKLPPRYIVLRLELDQISYFSWEDRIT